jgi:triosephosphate isomerase
MKPMSKLIIANWKMNPDSLAEAIDLAKESDVEGLVICPPFPFLEEVAKVLKKAKLGAQDLFWEEAGAYTGEVSAAELKDVGVEYVIIGHSERRQNLGETDQMIAKKIAAAIKGGLKPILCVGETRAERDAGKTKEIVERELKIGTSLIENLKLKIENFVVAYEPIWAIGTGTPDTPENMLEMVEFICKGIMNYELGIKNVEVIYGGSVTSANAESFLKHKEIGGALVGGASLKGEEIKKIVKYAH